MRLEISITDQRLRLMDGGGCVVEYIISSAANGVGVEEGSFCTPTGRFVIAEKIGEGEPIGTIFKGRKPVGVWKGEVCSDDLVLTRILWLDGLDPENANTKERYIYIHGTNQEERLGEPASCGCIRMGNAEIVDLFDRVNVGTEVTIFM
jgi:lipoprotein-anchoring transpeptidase ErfK/SrfK